MKDYIDFEVTMFFIKRYAHIKAFLTNDKGSAIVSVIVASAIGIVVILGVTTAIVNQATSQKVIQTANQKLWKSIQAQSIVDRFAKKDDSKNTDSTKECLAVLNDKVNNIPTSHEFKSRDCNPATDLGVDCSSNKIIYLKKKTVGAGELPEEWQDWTLPVLPSQCCSLFYERIITEANLKTDVSGNIQNEITTALALTDSTRETEVRDVVYSIIKHRPHLAHANTICGDAHAGGGGGADLDCYHVVEEVGDDDYGKTRVGCPKKGETVTAYLNNHQPTLFGFNAGVSNTIGSTNDNSGKRNTFIGNQAGLNNTTGYYNTFMGNHAGYTNKAGNNNTFIGNEAGFKNETGNLNTFIGSQAGKNNTASFNTFIGYETGPNNEGSYNTFIGNYAGQKNIGGEYNTFLGHQAGLNNTTGEHNIYIGYKTGCQSTSCEDDDYILDIGGLIKGHFGTGTHQVTIVGDLDVTGATTNTSDRRLKTKIKNLTKNLSKFLKLEPKTYFWKNKSISKKKQFGLIAQDVKKQYPELVSEDDKKFLRLNYTGFIPIIISAFKEFYGFVTNSLNSLTTQIADLKKSLQKEVSSLKKDNQKLKKAFQKDSKALQKEVSSLKKDNQQLEKRMKALEKAFVQK